MSFSDLPLLVDLLKEHTCKSPKDGSPCTCSHVSGKKSKPLVSDKRLRHWQHWMQQRKEVHQRLGQRLGRKPGELAMNSAEELRTVKEEKLALEYTNIPESDPQRGSPGFWKLPVGLKDECGKNETYFAVLSKEEKCEVPIIERIGHAKLIMAEKDVCPRTRNSCKEWERSAYVQNKETELSYELSRIRPHKPNFEDLYIEGVPVSKLSDNVSTPGVPETQPRHIKLPHTKETTSPERNLEKSSIMSLSVNDLQLSRHSNNFGTRKVYVLFESDTSINKKVVIEYLILKNLGTVALRFYWKKLEKVQLFKDIIPEEDEKIYFYFNKNEGIIIPGQIIQFPIWFTTRESGTYCEQWEFQTKPRIMPANSTLIIVLHASVVAGDLDTKMDAIREQLNKNVRDRLIKEQLFEITCNIPYDKFKPTVYSYNKKEVFETINTQFDPLHRQPRYLYNKEVVRELQAFYKKVRRPSDPKCWNYRIEELRLLAKSKQRKEDHSKWLAEQKIVKKVYEERPQFPTLLCEKNTFSEFLENKQHQGDAENLEDTTNTAVIDALKPLPEQLELLISKLECPAVEKNVDRDKFSQAYLILCTHFNKICHEFEDLEDRLGIVMKSKYPKFLKEYVLPLYYTPTRMTHETLYDVLQGPPLTAKVGTKADQPAAEALQNIPAEDVKKRYRTYYNLPDTPPPTLQKGKKDKGGKKDKKPDKKDKKSDKKGDKPDKKGKEDDKLVDSDEEDGYVVNEAFDPYAEVDLPALEEIKEEELLEGERVQSNIDTMLHTIRRQYKYNMYVIMYTYLDKAVSNIVDMIEMQPKENLPYAIIKELEEPKYNRRLIDLKGLLVEESVEQLKARLLVYKYRKCSKADWKTIEIQRQLKSVKSDSSLWSVLRSYETKPKLPDSKPISYPIDHYEVLSPHDQIAKREHEDKSDQLEEIDKPTDVEEPQLMVNISTSTLGDGKLDPTWEDFKDVSVQKDYGEGEEPEDLVAYIEKIISQTSVQKLIDVKLDKATQKKSNEHVSDEEHFYDSESEIDTEAVDLSVNSEQSAEDSCSCEGLGVCSLPVDERCSCEGLGVCNLSTDESCSCEGLGVCNFSIDESCSCEGLGVCNLPVDESCSCEGLGVCNLPTDESCSCEGLGVCNLPIDERCSCEGYGECNKSAEILGEAGRLTKNDLPSYGVRDKLKGKSKKDVHKLGGDCK